MDDILSELPAAPEVVIEIARGGVVKRRSDGTIDFISPVPCPYNYGFIPGLLSPDGDPLDTVVLGPRRRVGTRVRLPVAAVLDFRDQGAFDPKVICADRPMTRGDRLGLTAFFRFYAVAKRALALLRGQSGETVFRGFVPEARWQRRA